jgi:hypothetical protein
MRTFFLVLSMLIFTSTQSQKKDTLTIKRVQNDKLYKIVKGENVELRTDRGVDSRGIGKFRIVKGIFMFAFGDSIWIEASSQTICQDASEIDDYYYLNGDGILGVETRNYRNFIDTAGMMIPVHKEAIGEIKYNKYINLRKSMKFGSKAGLVSALIVAPLLAINYKTAAFNSNKYYWISGSSLLFVTTTFSLYQILAPKKFNIGLSESHSYYIQ